MKEEAHSSERTPLLGRRLYPRAEPLPQKRVDLHCHSSASNGATGKPAEIALKLKQAGFSAFALTEHDNFDSLDAASEGAVAAGIEFVPGIEVTARINDRKLPDQSVAHILGFYPQRTAELEAMVNRTYRMQVDILRSEFERLHRQNVIDFDEDDLARHTREAWGEDDIWKKPFNCPIPFWQMLENSGLPRSTLNLAPSAEALATVPDVREVCDTLHRAGAVVILAHPATATREQLLHWLAEYGDGIEIYHPRNSPEYRNMLLDVVKDTGCAFTGGGDIHWFGYDNMDELYSEAPFDCLESLKAVLNSR